MLAPLEGRKIRPGEQDPRWERHHQDSTRRCQGWWREWVGLALAREAAPLQPMPTHRGLGVAASGVLLLHTATRGRQRPGFEAFLGEEVAGLPWCQSWLCRVRVQRTLLPRSRGHLGPWAHPGSSQSEALEGGSLT